MCKLNNALQSRERFGNARVSSCLWFPLFTSSSFTETFKVELAKFHCSVTRNGWRYRPGETRPDGWWLDDDYSTWPPHWQWIGSRVGRARNYEWIGEFIILTLLQLNLFRCRKRRRFQCIDVNSIRIQYCRSDVKVSVVGGQRCHVVRVEPTSSTQTSLLWIEARMCIDLPGGTVEAVMQRLRAAKRLVTEEKWNWNKCTVIKKQ
jgi:hypothetical protein